MKNVLQKSVICLMAVMLVLSSCKKDKPAPAIPPVSTFAMSLSEFDTSKVGAYYSGDLISRDSTYNNWGHSAFNVFVWNIVITLNGIVPVAAFRESFNHEGIYQPKDDKWIWSYNVWVAGAVYKAELHAKLVNDFVHWEMYLSKQGAYNDFLWYEGDSKTDGSEGTWTLNFSPMDPKPYIGIAWHRNADGSVADIKYTNIIPGNAENGGYIFYGITTNTPYNAFYDIFNKGQNNLIEIEWNTTSKEGHVKDNVKFGNTEWHCWNNILQDINCN